MKTSKSIRSILAIMVALLVIGFASKSYADHVDYFLTIKDSTGESKKVTIHRDGTFETPPLHAGTYRWSFGTSSSNPNPPRAGAVHPISSGGDNPTESVSLNFTKIEVKYQEQTAREVASGHASGKRMHQPLTITKEFDKSSPNLLADLGTFTVETSGATISGSISGVYKNGNKSTMDAWDR